MAKRYAAGDVVAVEVKPIYQSKIFWVNMLSALVAILSLTEVMVLVRPEHMTYFTAFVAFVNVALRFITEAPVATRSRA